MSVINVNEIPGTPEKRREFIKYQLKISGTSISAFARSYGCQPTTAHKALDRPYPLWEKRISDFLGVMPEQLWPERYTDTGVPNRRRGKPVNSTQNRVDDSTKPKGKKAA